MTPPVPSPPYRPDPQECCNRGCCPCIFDYYNDALDRWRDRVTGMGLDPDQELANFAVKAAADRS
jgi:hypothetical protein